VRFAARHRFTKLSPKSDRLLEKDRAIELLPVAYEKPFSTSRREDQWLLRAFWRLIIGFEVCPVAC
jgi:hypothetical protein